MSDSVSNRPKPRVSQKGLRDQVTGHADYKKAEAKFDEKRQSLLGVTSKEEDEFFSLERRNEPRVNDLLWKAHTGISAYDFFSNIDNAGVYVNPHTGIKAPDEFFSKYRHKAYYLTPLFKAINLLGLAILNNEDIRGLVDQWWHGRLDSEEYRRNWTRFCNALKGPGSGRYEEIQSAPKRKQNNRRSSTISQQGYSIRKYKEPWKEEYRIGKKRLQVKGKATPQRLQKLVEGIVNREETPHTGKVKRAALKEFKEWAQVHIA